ncbi:MAG: TenA family protein [Pseudoflavonifractor sp.]|nr:TenA family protein [Alloprevotella sp.]MCM1117087.1 TenA family protein [Pseudoflavonifractor sp.]
MEQDRKWSDKAWQAGEPAYVEILRHPFVTELAAGTLSRERFERYIAQDSLYIHEYCRVLAHIASRLHDGEMSRAFLAFAADGVAVEQGLHSLYLPRSTRREMPPMSPACLFYTSLLKSTAAYEPVEVEAAAVLPCFWIYQRVGQWIVEHQSDTEQNPYRDWISTYSDPVFEQSCQKAIDICDSLAEGTSPAVRDRMTETYRQCSRMEWLFWHSAYSDLSYPVTI